MHDVIVRGGLVADGTTRPSVHTDVAIDDGIITQLGSHLGPAHRVVDASDCVVAPGFIDPHTHLDAQLFWDPSGAPAAHHGVTTVVLSACGFGIAPCGAGDADALLRTLAVVEEIPYECMRDVVPMSWPTWSDYLDTIESLSLGVNVGAFLAHSPLRYHTMGERAATEHASTDEERRILATAEAALAAGALGLATSRGPNHVDALSRPVPSRMASDRELRALVGLCDDRPWQVNLRAKGDTVNEMTAEIATYSAWSVASGARLSWTPLLARPGNPAWRELLDHNRQLVGAGARVHPQFSPRPISISLGFDGQCRALHGIESWRDAFRGWDAETIEGRRHRARSIGFRQAVSGPDPVLFGARFPSWIVTSSPSRPELAGRPLSDAYCGPSPVQEFFDCLVDDDFQTVLQIPIANTDDGAIVELVRDENTLLGLGDAGAHTSANTSYAYPTYLLSALVREKGSVPLEEAVFGLSAQPAAFLGITDRGTIQPGKAADICVFDLSRLELMPPVIRHDLPGGLPHLDQGARGYRTIMVNGRVTVEDDTPLEVGAGRTLRR